MTPPATCAKSSRNTTIIAIASTMKGMEKKMSVTRISMSSITPPLYPANAPKSIPTVAPAETTASDMARSTLAALIIAGSRFTPKYVVPRGYLHVWNHGI